MGSPLFSSQFPPARRFFLPPVKIRRIYLGRLPWWGAIDINIWCVKINSPLLLLNISRTIVYIARSNLACLRGVVVCDSVCVHRVTFVLIIFYIHCLLNMRILLYECMWVVIIFAHVSSRRRRLAAQDYDIINPDEHISFLPKTISTPECVLVASAYDTCCSSEATIEPCLESWLNGSSQYRTGSWRERVQTRSSNDILTCSVFRE